MLEELRNPTAERLRTALSRWFWRRLLIACMSSANWGSSPRWATITFSDHRSMGTAHLAVEGCPIGYAMRRGCQTGQICTRKI